MLNCHRYLLNIFYNYKFFVNNCNINLKVWGFYIFTWQSLAILSHNAPMRKHMWKQFDKYKPQLTQVYSSGIPAKMHISRLSLMTWKCNPVILRKPCLFPIDSWEISEIPKWNISTLWSSLVLKLQKHGACDLSLYSGFSKPFQRNPLREEELLRPVLACVCS